DSREWPQAHLAGDFAAGDQQRCTAVGQRRRVTGGDLPIDLREARFHGLVVERRTQRRQRLDGGAGPDDLVGGQACDRNELVVEEPLLGRPRRLLVAGGGELVEFGPG